MASSHERTTHLQARKYTAWGLVKAYWQSEQRFSAYLMIGSVLFFTILLVSLEVALNYWYNNFYNALQEYDVRSTIDLLSVFLLIVSCLIIIAVYRYYIQSYLGLRWRRWLTNQFIDRWLQKKSYYYLENFDEKTDNPDQRIQEDVGSLVTSSLTLLVGFVNAVATFFAFIYILWTLSGILKVSLGGHVFVIPGYLAWIGIIYAMLGTYLTFKIGFPLIQLNFNQQKFEANFRFAAVDLREHAEHVALYRGEHHQKSLLSSLVERFLQNWYMIILRQKLLLWFTAGYNQLSVFLPLIAALPNYFNRVFKLGGLIQALRAFTNVQEALSFFVTSYSAIAELRAVMKRLLTFINHIYEVEESAIQNNQFKFAYHPKNSIETIHVDISTPRGELLLANVNENFQYGKNYLIKGVSGIGKSTFIRAIAGIWPYGSGEILLPRGQHIMYVPQKPYMPIGTLKEALLFPDHIHPVADAQLQDLLLMFNLPRLVDSLKETAMWSMQLSPGEQQRIALIRVLLHKPAWVFLDESTSSLDLESEKMVFDILKDKLPQSSLVTVGHRPSLDEYHDVNINMEKYIVAKEFVC